MKPIGAGAGGFDFNAEGKFLSDAIDVRCVAFDLSHGLVLPALIDWAVVAMNRLQDVSVRIESRPAVNLVTLGLLSGVVKSCRFLLSCFFDRGLPQSLCLYYKLLSEVCQRVLRKMSHYFQEFFRNVPVFYSFGIKFRTVTPSACARAGKLSMLGDFRPPSQD